MPQIQRQVANGKPAIRRIVSTDSILARAVGIEELTDCKYQMIFYGRNRIGKTTLACQFPKPLLLVSLDPRSNGGADSVRRIAGIKNVRMGEHMSTSEDVERLGHELKADCPFATVVVDGLTALEELLLAEICGWEQTANMLRFPRKGEANSGAVGRASQDQYTERSEKVRKVLRPFIDLKTCHVLFIANEKDHNPQEGERKSQLVRGPHTESMYGPAVGSGAARWLNDSCNYIIQLYVDKEVKTVAVSAKLNGKDVVTEQQIETGKVTRRARLQMHLNYMAGFCSPTPELVPEYVEAVKPEEMYAKIMSVARGVKVK